MNAGLLVGSLAVAGGVALGVGGMLARGRERDRELAEVLGLPYGEQDVDVARLVAEHGPVVQGTLGLANRAIDRVGSNAGIRRKLEQADLSIRPSELVVTACALGLAIGLHAMQDLHESGRCAGNLAASLRRVLDYSWLADGIDAFWSDPAQRFSRIPSDRRAFVFQ